MQIRKRFAKVAIGACCLGAFVAGPAARAQAVPAYRVDPYWPKPLPSPSSRNLTPTQTKRRRSNSNISRLETGFGTTAPCHAVRD